MKLRLYLILLVLSLCLTQTSVSAQNNDFKIYTSNISIDIETNRTSTFTAILNISVTSTAAINTIELEIGTLLSNVETTINGTLTANSVQKTDTDTKLSVTPGFSFNQNDRIQLKITADLDSDIDKVNGNKYQLFFNWGMTPTPDYTNISITLPQGAIVSTSQGDLNIFPAPSDIDSDGQKQTIKWINLPGTTQNTQVFVQYLLQDIQTLTTSLTGVTTVSDNTVNTVVITVLVSIMLTLIGGIGYLFYLLREQNKLSSDTEKQPDTEAKDENENTVKVIRVIKPVIIKPSEQEVLKLIADAGGAINQTELVNLLDVSKARVSQYLSDFEERNLIKKEKMGRQNLIKLNIDENDLDI